MEVYKHGGLAQKLAPGEMVEGVMALLGNLILQHQRSGKPERTARKRTKCKGTKKTSMGGSRLGIFLVSNTAMALAPTARYFDPFS
jgi:hypothetical protein